MNNRFISRFTPSVMTGEDLLSIFVQRRELLEHIKAGLKESVETAAKHQYLLVGPRGIGKTHLISLLFYDLSHWQQYKQKFFIAWLREEEFVASFLDLIMRILRAIQEQQPDLLEAQDIESVYNLPLQEAQEKATDLLIKLLGSRSLCIFAENIQDIFDGIGDEGQRRLRALIQQTSKIFIVASTPSLFASISLQTSPFYGFFEVEHLAELTLQDAIRLLSKIAAREGSSKLLKFIGSSEGRAKIGTIYHLAGGNHRLYIILAQFLKSESLTDIVEPFMELIDNLTPYYQAQIASLSPQQRKIVQFLCEARYAVSVKEIASRSFITQQTASSQLKELKDKGFVLSTQLARESRYEVREPLMRFCMEVKQARGRPIKVLVQLLETWYTNRELSKLKEIANQTSTIAGEYIAVALKGELLVPTVADSAEIRELEDKLNERLKERDLKAVCQLMQEIVAKRGSAEDHDKLGFVLATLKYFPESLKQFENALRLDPLNKNAKRHKIMSLIALNKTDECIELINGELKENKGDASLWDCLGIALAEVDPKQAFAAYEKSLNIRPNEPEVITRGGAALVKLEKYEEAVKWFERALALEPNNVLALILNGYVLGSLEHSNAGLVCLNQALKIDDYSAQAWLGKAMILLNLERYEDALSCCEKAMALESDLITAHFYRVVALLGMRRVKEYKKELEALLRRYKKSPHIPPGDIGGILRHLVEAYSNETIWKERLTELFELFNQYELMPTLATGLGNTVPSLVSDHINDKTVELWIKTCNEVFSHRDEFAVAIRLLKTSLSYKKNHDPNVSLELASEERQVFRQLLDMQKDVERAKANKTLSFYD